MTAPELDECQGTRACPQKGGTTRNTHTKASPLKLGMAVGGVGRDHWVFSNVLELARVLWRFFHFFVQLAFAEACGLTSLCVMLHCVKSSCEI